MRAAVVSPSVSDIDAAPTMTKISDDHDTVDERLLLVLTMTIKESLRYARY